MDYYSVAREASRDFVNHPAFPYFKTQAKHAPKILDAGCGEGTRLHLLAPSGARACGLDINRQAINLARKQYPRHEYIVYNGGHFPLPDTSFDLVYSTYVLEHTKDPKMFIDEMVRVLRPGGTLVLLCPNFGAPNRRSPCSIQPPLQKLLLGIWKDFFPSAIELDLTHVTPKPYYHQIDDDTTVEPYLPTIKRYLTKAGLKAVHVSSLWSLEEKTKNPRKLLFKYLGGASIFPFIYWGPQLFIITQKTDDKHD